MKIVPPYRPTSPINIWECTDTLIELRGGVPRQLPQREPTDGTLLTWIDGMAGGGGSSEGIHSVPGNTGAMAVNHWPLAIETHNHNMPWMDHDVANVGRIDPRRYKRTDMGWFSPECTFWSVARGDKCDYDRDWEQTSLSLFDTDDDGDPETPAQREARWRSRLLMRNVIDFIRHHRYKGGIVENVPDILKWANFPRWCDEIRAEGYRVKVITLNSAFAHNYGDPAPQLRDRVYIVFWQVRYRTPNWDKWLRPQSWCPRCQEVVRGIYAPKPGPRRPMRYKAQYVYRCPNKRCERSEVMPYTLPAMSAIDFNLPAERIGDRKRPLAPATRARVEAGIRKWWGRHFLAETAGNTFERRPGVRTWPVDVPMGTQTTTASKSLATPPLLVPTGGTRRRDAAPVDVPMATRVTRENDAVVAPPFLSRSRSGHGPVDPLVVPLESRDGHPARSARQPLRTQTGRHLDALVVPLRNNGIAAPPALRPLHTFAAGGHHHALVMRNTTARGDESRCTSVGEPMRTFTASVGQTLIERATVEATHALYSYDTGLLRPLGEPLPAQTTVEGDAVLGAETVNVNDCTLRMLAVPEIQLGMAFRPDYVLLGSAKRDKVAMLGNAVTPNASRDLVAALTEAITGVEYELNDFARVW